MSLLRFSLKLWKPAALRIHTQGGSHKQWLKGLVNKYLCLLPHPSGRIIARHVFYDALPAGLNCHLLQWSCSALLDCDSRDCSLSVASVHVFPRQEHGTGLPFPSSGESSWSRDGTPTPMSPCPAVGFFTTAPPVNWLDNAHFLTASPFLCIALPPFWFSLFLANETCATDSMF